MGLTDVDAIMDLKVMAKGNVNVSDYDKRKTYWSFLYRMFSQQRFPEKTSQSLSLQKCFPAGQRCKWLLRDSQTWNKYLLCFKFFALATHYGCFFDDHHGLGRLQFEQTYVLYKTNNNSKATLQFNLNCIALFQPWAAFHRSTVLGST